jgi:recombination protein RecR
MVSHVPSLEVLVHELSKLPGIGPKSAQRLAYFLLRRPKEEIGSLRQALQDVKEKVRECIQCFSYTENEQFCKICSDSSRLNDVLCVVEDPSGIIRIESSGVFKGRYHVLQGVISPLDGITPDRLKIHALTERLRMNRAAGTPIREIILALDADLEGDTTVLYLSKVLKDFDVSISRIAHGVPIGGDIDYIDHRTLGRAIENRVQL